MLAFRIIRTLIENEKTILKLHYPPSALEIESAAIRAWTHISFFYFLFTIF